MSETRQKDGCCATCRHWDPRVWPLGYCPIVSHTTDRSHGTQCTAHEPQGASEPDAAEQWWRRHASLLAEKMRRGGVRKFRVELTPRGTFAFEVVPVGEPQTPKPAKPGPFAVPPLRVDERGRVVDATGSQVLVCSEDGNCTLRFNEQAVDADGAFVCPSCGRLGLRMVEARPGQCGLPDGSTGEKIEGGSHE